MCTRLKLDDTLCCDVHRVLTLPGQAVDSLCRDWASRILGLLTASPIGSCSFLPAKASWENAVWYPGVSSISMKCSSSGMLSSSGNSNKPIRAWSTRGLQQDMKSAFRGRAQHWKRAPVVCRAGFLKVLQLHSG